MRQYNLIQCRITPNMKIIISSMFKRGNNTRLALFGSSKRIKEMKSQKIIFESEEPFKGGLEDLAQIKKRQKIRAEIPKDWQLLNFQQICNLKPQILRELELQVIKQKMNIGDDKFKTQYLVDEPQQALNYYWKKIFQTFCNLREVSSEELQRIVPKKYDAQIYLDDPLEDEELAQKISSFVNNMRYPQKLERVAQPTFCKYLLGLRRDLLMKGVDIDRFWGEEKRKIQLSQILSYEYQFWVDVKQNRAKNGNEKDFIVEKKLIKNPNETILIKEEWPQVQMTYITKKKRSKDYEMCFCTKIFIEILVDGHRHVVKVEKKGPNSSKEQTKEEYYIIDYDGIFKGNPSVKSIFVF